jgi:hypothetical protein
VLHRLDSVLRTVNRRAQITTSYDANPEIYMLDGPPNPSRAPEETETEQSPTA